MTRTVIGLVVVVLVTLAGGRAGAQEQSVTEQARARFEAGTALFQEGNLGGALVEFEASYRLRPAAVVEFNIAQTLKLLLRYEEAIAAYRRYLEMGAATIDAQRRADIEVTIERLRQATAYVVVDCAPTGAQVQVDGRTIGRVPLSGPISVAAGRRVVQVSLTGRLPEHREVELAGGATQTICVRLRPNTEGSGVLEVRTTVAGAAVRIDGAAVGTAPLEHRVGTGSHVVEVRASGYERSLREVRVGTDERRSIEVVLRERSRGLLSRWWFWTIAGAVVAGGVTAALLWRAPDEEPFRGTVDPDIVSAAW